MSERLCVCGAPIADRSALDSCKPCYHRNYRRAHYHSDIKHCPQRLEAHRRQCREAMARRRADPEKREAINQRRRKSVPAGALQPQKVTL